MLAVYGSPKRSMDPTRFQACRVDARTGVVAIPFRTRAVEIATPAAAPASRAKGMPEYLKALHDCHLYRGAGDSGVHRVLREGPHSMLRVEDPGLQARDHGHQEGGSDDRNVAVVC